MAEDRPQIYLISPSDPDPELFADRLARVLDTVGIACVRLVTTTRDEMRIGRAADALRAVAHERDVAIVIETHFRMAERHGLDGVHLSDGARSLREARKLLGPDAIVGAFCGASRHEGMTAGEAGADYVSFGPVGTSALGSGATAEQALFAWWSEMIEVPVVAEGGLSPELVRACAPVCDFLGIGDEIWISEDPVASLTGLLAPLG
ncbi:MAG: thiamine phosphate synthase [Defluviimonas sp.]|uniref:thiamine phosphate synthase n=1 Tax=Albidovulum sp. TaxID=1872424 RepID=UPI001E18302F|nr:thiamine phosphate synthase [Paracoccaceae bacterium]MCC0064175.1 thiamine phosphate synthase [Defluviimonas sp.]